MPHQVHHHPGTPGDAAVTKRYEAFQKHEEALKQFEEATRRLTDAKSEVARAEGNLDDRTQRLRQARDALDAIVTPEGFDP